MLMGYSYSTATDDADTFGPATDARLADELLDALRVAAALKAEHGADYAPIYGHLYSTLSVHLRLRGLGHDLIIAAISTALETGQQLSHVTAEMGGRLDGTKFVSTADAQRVADVVCEHFGGDADYAPQVMDADWDEEGGRVIVWSEGLPDWACLVNHGGVSDFGCSREWKPVAMPAGFRAEVVNTTAIRVLAA